MRGFAKYDNRSPSHFRADPVSGEKNNGLLHGTTPYEKIVVRHAA
jgi:hypothetical protein